MKILQYESEDMTNFEILDWYLLMNTHVKSLISIQLGRNKNSSLIVANRKQNKSTESDNWKRRRVDCISKWSLFTTQAVYNDYLSSVI